MSPRTLALALVCMLAAPMLLSAQLLLERDVLFAGIRVGMTKAAVDSLATANGWIKKKSRKKAEAVYSHVNGVGTESHLIRFKKDKVISVSTVTTVAADTTNRARGIFLMMRRMIEERAEKVERKGETMTTYHACSNGRKVKTVWKPDSKVKEKVTVEAVLQ